MYKYDTTTFYSFICNSGLFYHFHAVDISPASARVTNSIHIRKHVNNGAGGSSLWLTHISTHHSTDGQCLPVPNTKTSARFAITSWTLQECKLHYKLQIMSAALCWYSHASTIDMMFHRRGITDLLFCGRDFVVRILLYAIIDLNWTIKSIFDCDFITRCGTAQICTHGNEVGSFINHMLSLKITISAHLFIFILTIRIFIVHNQTKHFIGPKWNSF